MVAAHPNAKPIKLLFPQLKGRKVAHPAVEEVERRLPRLAAVA
jgi:hypothetical protein